LPTAVSDDRRNAAFDEVDVSNTLVAFGELFAKWQIDRFQVRL
jgi:hypothetical protein